MEVIPYNYAIKFKDKTILITGASSDIGFEIACQLDQLEATLILHASGTNGSNKLREQFGGANHQVFVADFANPEGLGGQVKPVLEGVQLDGYINCVGIRSRRPIKLLKPDHLNQVMTINFGAYIEMIRIVTRKGQYNSKLSILGISSIAAHSGAQGVTAYAASKAAMESATRCLAKELFAKGIRINTIVSGQVNTKAYTELMASRANKEDKVLERQFLGLADPSDLASIALFLLSEQSSLITGSSFPADGGYLIS